MKTKLLLSAFLFSFTSLIFAQCPGSPPPGYTCIPDNNFEQYLITNGIDSEATLDGQILTSDINTRQILDVTGVGISDLTGIQDFAALQTLTCPNNSLTSLGLSSNTMLLTLNCNNNLLTSIDVMGCNSLNYITCTDNDLTTLDLSNKGNLEQVRATNNPNLSSLDLSSSNFLRVLIANSTSISDLDLSSKTNLQYLECSDGNLSSLLIGAAPSLYHLLVNNNQLTTLDLTSCGQPVTALTVIINCDDNLLNELNIKNGDNTRIDTFSALNNNLTCITVDDDVYSTTNWTNIDPGVAFSTNCALSVDDFKTPIISVFPNPSKGKIYVGLKTKSSYSLYNVIGQEMKRGTFASGNNELDIHALSNGVYFLKVESANKKLVKRIIKN